MHRDPSAQLHINFPSKSSSYFQRLCPSSSRFSIGNNHTQNSSQINFQHSIPKPTELQQSQAFQDVLLTKIAQMEQFVTGLKKNVEKKQISMLQLQRQRVASSTLNCKPNQLNNAYQAQKNFSLSHLAHYKVNTENNISSIIHQNSIESMIQQDNEKLRIQKLVQLVKNRAPSKQYSMRNSLYVSSLSQAEKKQQNQCTSTHGEGMKKKIQRSKNNKKVTIKLNNNHNYTKTGYLDIVIQNENQNTINISPKSKQKKSFQPKPLKLKN